MSLQIQVCKRAGEEVWLDLSQRSAQMEVLEALQDNGWIILRNAANLNSIEEARRNKVNYFLSNNIIPLLD